MRLPVSTENICTEFAPANAYPCLEQEFPLRSTYMTDLADHNAATTAGYRRIQVDRGVDYSPRSISKYEKPSTGQPGSSGGLMSAEDNSDVSQAAADTIALNALNGQRRHRYAGPGALAGSPPAALRWEGRRLWPAS
jgi:hypothetical protein